MNHHDIIKRFEPTPDNLLPMLHAIQDGHTQNYLTADALKAVAAYMKMTMSSVYGVVGYYTMFSTSPRGRFIVRVCNSPVCHLSGSENAIAWAKDILGVELNQTTADGLFTLEESECLGRCGKSPSMMINREFYGNLTQDKLLEIFKEIRIKSNNN
jgi:NADH-quinone oxidoreductase subunit E